MADASCDFAFRIQDVSRRYSGDTIHFPGEIDIPRGELIGVLGRSGSGKTTLLNLLALMDQSDGGTITYYSPTGESRSYDKIYGNAEASARFRQEKFGFVFQNDELLDGFSVRDNIQMPYWPSGKQLAPAGLMDLITSLKLHEIQGIVDRNPADLSAGQRSRIGLLRAFSGSPEPEIIFADEPTANVDVHLETEIYRLLERWRSDPGHPERTILLSTHRLDIASKYCTSYIIIKKDAAGNSEGVLLHGRRTEEELKDLVVGNLESRASSEEERVVVANETQPHSRLRALWKFLFYDFWRYPRAENNFLVTRLAPLLVVVALFLFVWLGSFILGIREGSRVEYSSQMSNDLLWNTQIDADEGQIQELKTKSETEGQRLFSSFNGFHRRPVLIYRASETDYTGNRGAAQLIGRTMEDKDPLLNRIGETLVSPKLTADRAAVLKRYRDAEFGIIISQDVLVDTLGYMPEAWPEALPVRLDSFVRVWMPVLGVAREIPNADFILHPSVDRCYTVKECLKDALDVSSFYLETASEIQSEESALMRIEPWLAGLGIQPENLSVSTIRGEQVIQVDLASSRPAFDLVPLIKKNLGPIRELVSGMRLTNDLRDDGILPYSHWSVIVEHDMKTIHELIRTCYFNNMVIDTSIQARVSALQGSYRIFTTLSLMLFLTALILASVLLFSTIWFDSNRKTHAVGVMLGLGISRPLLIAAYALQFYLLIGVLLVAYAIADAAGVLSWLAGALGQLGLEGGKEGLVYVGWSQSWFGYIGVVLLIVPAIIAALRSLIYKNHPAELLNTRD